MAKTKVEKILDSEPDAWQGLTKTTFMSEGKVIYIFTKPENVPKEGEKLDGDISQDRGGKNKFTKTKSPWATGEKKRYDGPKKGVSMRDDASIKAQWAIGQAVQLHNQMQTGTNIELDWIEATAKDLYAMISRVKNSDIEKVQETIPGSELL